MNHYINLLEPAERQYVRSAEINPLWKLGGAALLVALLGWGYLNYQGLRSTVQEGGEVREWLAANSEAVEAATARIAASARVEKARTTLAGWKASRYDFPSIFTVMAREIPDPADRTQFTSLSFDEEIIGLTQSRSNPGPGETKYYPLVRKTVIQLEGRIQSDQPEQVLERYRSNLATLGEDLPVRNIFLRLEEEIAPMEEANVEQRKKITSFSAEFELTPLEMTHESQRVE